MGEILVYSMVSSVVLTAMYAVYKLALAAENQHGYNRAVLWLIYVAALSLPAVASAVAGLSWRGMAEPLDGVFDVGLPTASMTDGAEAWPGVVTAINIIGGIYFAGMAIAGLIMVGTIARLAMLIGSGQRYDYGTMTVIVHDGRQIAPFSWRRYIVMNRADFEESCDVILVHESCHAASHHWIDLIMAQLVIVFQWYNPTAWLMREEFKSVHEYQADAAVIASGSDIKQYQMLLIKKAVGGRFQSLANSLNHSNLKKRITMMYKSKSTLGRRFRALALAPAALMAVAVVNIPAVASALTTVSRTLDADKVTKNAANGQTDPEKVYEAVDVNPEYPGGVYELMKFVAENLRYPEKAMADSVQGRVVVKFVVNREGKVVSPEILHSVSPEIDEEALRVVSLLEGFTPGTIGGEPVNVSYALPLTFRLTGGKE